MTGKRIKRLTACLLIIIILLGTIPFAAVGANPDTQAPTAPAGLISIWRTETSVHLTWTASSDDTGVAGYDIYNGSALAGSTNGTPSFLVTGLAPGGTYTFTVRAKDAAGNVSPPSASYVVTAGILDAGAWTANASASGSPSSQAIDGSMSTRWTSGAAQTAGMWFQIDTGPTSKTYDKLRLDAGTSVGDYPRGYEVRVSDDGANWSEPVAVGTGTSAVVNIGFQLQSARFVRIVLTKNSGSWWSIHNLSLFGNLAPDTSPPTTPANSAAPFVTDDEIRLSWDAASDNVGIWGYDVYDGNRFAGFTKSTSLQLKGLTSLTTYAFTIKAKDLAGNESALSPALPVKTKGALARSVWKASASASGSGSAPAQAIDASMTTRWASGSAQAPGMWFQIDTGPSEKSYTKLTLDAGSSANDYPRGYEIRVSADGANWSGPVATATGTSGKSTVTFDPQTARYVRIILTKSAGLWWSIYDLNVYGELASDHIPPTVPGNVSVVSKTDTEVELAWAASNDNVGILEYQVYGSGTELVGRTESTAYRVTGLTPKTAYNFSIRAKDLSGNVSEASVPVTVTTEDVILLPIIAKYEMEPSGTDSAMLVDESGLGHDGLIKEPAAYVDGRSGGKALRLTGSDQARVAKTSQLNNISSKMTVSAWLRPEDLNGNLPIVSKRDDNWKGSTFYLRLTGNRLGFTGDYGEKTYDWSFPSPSIVAGQWFHVAVTFEKYVGVKFYVNGELIGSVSGSDAFTDLLPNDVNMLIGTEWHWDTVSRTVKKYGFRGSIDSLRIYAAPLTPGQIKADMNNTIAVRPAQQNDFTMPTKWATFRLVRFDMPTGLLTKGSAKIHQNAIRTAGPDAVDWPDITLQIPQADKSVKTVRPFAVGTEYKTEIMLQRQGQSKLYLQQPYDNVLQPGNHWVRGVAWRWGQTYMYNADRTSRTWVWDHELWAFPVKIAGNEAGAVKQVVLKNGGTEIYNSGASVYNSLTLLLPQNEEDKPYELWVDGRGPVYFNAGLQPIVPGDPKDVAISVKETIPGTGPMIAVNSLDRPETFPNQAAWNSDSSALSGPQPEAQDYVADRSSIARHVGVDVPLSPESINFVYMPHGMSSGGFYHSEHRNIAARYQDIGTLEEYADYVSGTGYDRVFEFSMFGDATSPISYEKMAEALDRRGVQLGLVPVSDLDSIDMRSPNLAFYSHNLPDFRAPLYRDVQLGLQRFNVFPNMAGISIGADNAGYFPYWDWAPPIPSRPWGTAYTAFQSGAGQPLSTPLTPSLRGTYNPKAHEYFAPEVRPFLDYINRYNETYKQYGYFAKAVSEIDSRFVTTTGSFGSSQGTAGRGGYPSGTIPAKPMHEQLPVQTAYDWNELNASKPLHLVALIDRLRSSDPAKTTWATQDDFSLFLGKMDREKAYALALTRGIQAIGTNVLPNDKGSLAKPQTVAEQKELYAWIHKYGGAYAMAEPTPSVGILYVNEQSLLRGIVGGENPSDAQLLKGSHEGKVSEALFLSHAAGWPAKVITPEELTRGLPSSIKTIMLVGLNNFDDSWNWYDGLTKELQSFVDRGGRILKDDESVSPVAAVDTGMQVRAYVVQSNTDQTNVLFARNADNIAKLKAVMNGIEPPLAISDESSIWAIPTRAGDTRYVTVLNEKHDQNLSNSQHLVAQSGTVVWNTERPIYDIRKGRKLTVQEATYVDLRTEGFQWYALPPSEVTTPSVTATKGTDGFYEAFAAIEGSDPIIGPMTGIPVELTVTNRESGDTATVYSATGLTAKLPLKNTDAPGVYTVTVKELLSGLSSSMSVVVQAPPAANPETTVILSREADIGKFADRTNVPLTVALTAEQNGDPAIVEQANRLVQWFIQRGRAAQLGLAEPNGVVVSLQEYRSSYVKYPQWKTIESDLVLIGSASNNVLLLDQARGLLLPKRGADLAAGQAAVSVAKSPFVGEYHALNIITNDAAGLTAAVDRLLQVSSSEPAVPQFLTVSKVTETSAGLAWSAGGGSLAGAEGFGIERRTNGLVSWRRVGTVSGSTEAKFTDTGLLPDTLYTYRVIAYNDAGESAGSEPVRIVTAGSRDRKPPITQAAADGNSGAGAFYNKAVTVTFSADDGIGGSGVKRTSYKVDDQGWETVTGAIYVSEEGIHTLQYFSEDMAGNLEQIRNMTVSIDKTAPETVATAPIGWSRTPQSVLLNATDGLSGVAQTYYSVSNSVYGSVYGQMAGSIVPVTLEGINTVTFYSVDAAGNRENNKTAVIRLDYTPPKVEVITPLTFYQYERVPVSVNVYDPLSGVARTDIFFDGKAQTNLFAFEPLTLSVGDHRLTVRSTDAAGNEIENVYVIHIVIDEEHLDELLRKAAEMGFIDNHGDLNSLLAKENLGALKNEVLAQKGKHIDAAFVDMLLTDIDVLIRMQNQH